MILKNSSASNIRCWNGAYVLSWVWWSLLTSRVGCFGYTDKSWVFSGTNCKVWAKRKYDSVHWINNI